MIPLQKRRTTFVSTHAIQLFEGHNPRLWSRPKAPSKSLYEGARLAISDTGGYFLDCAARHQQLHRPRQPNLTPPRLEVGANVFAKYPLNRSDANSGIGTKGGQGCCLLRGCQHRPCHRHCSLIPWERHVGRHRRCRFHVQYQQVSKCSLMVLSGAKVPNPYRFENEFTQQRRYVQHRADKRRCTNQSGPEIKCAHRDRVRHINSVAGFCGKPDGGARRNQPHVSTRKYFHDPANGVDQLIRPMSVFRDLKPSGVFISERRDGNPALWIELPENAQLSHWRYIMAHYPPCASTCNGP